MPKLTQQQTPEQAEAADHAVARLSALEEDVLYRSLIAESTGDAKRAEAYRHVAQNIERLSHYLMGAH